MVLAYKKTAVAKEIIPMIRFIASLGFYFNPKVAEK